MPLPSNSESRHSDLRLVMTVPMALGVSGGGVVGALKIARYLRRAGAEVTVMPLMTHQGYERPRVGLPERLVGEDREAELRAEGIEVIRVAPALDFVLDGRACRLAVRRLLGQRPVDAVLGWNQEFSWLPPLLRRRRVVSGAFAAGNYDHLDRPRVRNLFKKDRDRIRRFVMRQLMLRSYGGADVVFAISHYLRQCIVDILGLDPKRTEVAYWGVEPIFARAERGAPEPVRRLFFFGSSAPRKGIPDTLRALGGLRRQGFEDWTLKLIAWDRDHVGDMAREHGVEDKVVMLDPMDHAHLVRELEWAQVAILPSKYESFGLACAECQASGLPVIAYDVGGVGEVVLDGRTGWLVPLGSVEGLMASIREAVADPERTHRMGLEGRRHVQESFAWERTTDAVLRRLAAIRAERGW